MAPSYTSNTTVLILTVLVEDFDPNFVHLSLLSEHLVRFRTFKKNLSRLLLTV